MIIKDKIIRETLKNWASINNIPEVKCEIFDYDYGGVCIYDGIIQFGGIPYRLGIQFENKIRDKSLESGRIYSIKELVSEK